MSPAIVPDGGGLAPEPEPMTAEEADQFLAAMTDPIAGPDTVHSAGVLASSKLRAYVKELRQDAAECESLRDRMSDILRRTADALHGGPLENGYWSWHDLPELATKLREPAVMPLTVSLLEFPPTVRTFRPVCAVVDGALKLEAWEVTYLDGTSGRLPAAP